ncbi:MAG: bifunctional alpha/beta hydrolase/OsmC family protein [Actinobacteria bacterium]|nr:bifunctional alpha/beta hydrolase/OsmC family protein [Actinomycetota bacterium]MBU1608417.1 bifunctional alpha/beta hydrolase/OsmC family protein [Actinomycetota bacterium]MBU2316461.1 bifunctional alpha/beta hydrolase/OsmC family protein [Actinomycetota bacterium]MBU2385405.1 bifunctional alpha/beta hydrolase/OsmC family protein [Actinomycetota bacterium]
MPQGEPRGYAVFAHCFTCSKDSTAASRISRALTGGGIAVLRFDFTGLGDSDGDFSNTNFSSNVDDLVAAAEYLQREHRAPTLLIGHSLGGAAVIAAAERVPSVRAVATIGAPSDPSHVTALFDAARESITTEGEADVQLAGRTFRIRRQLLDDLAAQPQHDRIAGLHRALLVLHSPIDEIVGVDNAREIFEAARHPKSFMAIDGADHLLTAARDSTFAASIIAAWAARYALDARPQSDDATAVAPPGSVSVSSTAEGPFTQTVVAGSHRWTADEPAPIGNDLGPSPYDLLLAGLGACTSMTMRMYADRKGIPLEGVTVTLRHERLHAQDCSECETRTGMLDHVVREITMTGDLSAEQIESLRVIADKCPVHRTLTGAVHVTTTVET